MRPSLAAYALALTGVLFGCGAQTPTSPADTEGDTDSPFDDLTTGPKLDLDNADGVQTEGNAEADSGCADIEVVVEPVIPTLVLLVDQSGSMTDDFSGQQRWDAVYETLMDPVDGVVVNLESQVRFGLTLYTSEDGFEGGECPMLTTVAPALDNHMAIDAAYAPADPVDETPTGESLEAVATQLLAFEAEGPKGIVLATDGEPDTCDQPNPQNGQMEALSAAGLAAKAGISTFIISVGDDVGAEHLQQMANVGVGKDIDDPDPAPYYQALDAQELVAAFEEIIGSFISCQLVVDGIVDPEAACDGTVLLDGVELECGTDWNMPDPSTLELLGEACDTLSDGGEHQVDASWPCDAVAIP